MSSRAVCPVTKDLCVEGCLSGGCRRQSASRAPAHLLHDHLVAAMCASAAGMARRERLLGRGMSIEKFAENCIRATLHALNQQQEAEEANKPVDYEMLGYSMLTDEQAVATWERFKSMRGAYVAAVFSKVPA